MDSPFSRTYASEPDGFLGGQVDHDEPVRSGELGISYSLFFPVGE
jgi:hypothetical protein